MIEGKVLLFAGLDTGGIPKQLSSYCFQKCFIYESAYTSGNGIDPQVILFLGISLSIIESNTHYGKSIGAIQKLLCIKNKNGDKMFHVEHFIAVGFSFIEISEI
ncbi:MAG: hypothetical protein WBV27_05995 [Trichococcus sp.]|uniref:hypothetical protein n=1 Tax=Trichococcus sp. TaxID=1985464 RepID=UPI003C3276CA